MKKLNLIIFSSVLSFSITGCSTSQVNQNGLISEQVQIASKAGENVYPFDLQKDFFPLYNATYWKYDIFDKDNNFISSLTKTLDSVNENSIDLDKKHNYYVIALKKTYSATNIKDKEPFEYFRRRENQVSYGKTDLLTYYPANDKSSATKADYDPYAFRPYANFSSSKTEKITVKAGTFDCTKTEFTLGMDSYTIWYAKGIGEIKRIRDTSGFLTYHYELSEYKNQAQQQFLVKKEILNSKDLPQSIISKATLVKSEYLKLNELPSDLFEMKANTSLFVDTSVIKYNNENIYEIVYVNKSLLSRDNVNFTVLLSFQGDVRGINVNGDNQNKPQYKGKVVDKLPSLVQFN